MRKHSYVHAMWYLFAKEALTIRKEALQSQCVALFHYFRGTTQGNKGTSNSFLLSVCVRENLGEYGFMLVVGIAIKILILFILMLEVFFQCYCNDIL